MRDCGQRQYLRSYKITMKRTVTLTFLFELVDSLRLVSTRCVYLFSKAYILDQQKSYHRFMYLQGWHASAPMPIHTLRAHAMSLHPSHVRRTRTPGCTLNGYGVGIFISIALFPFIPVSLFLFPSLPRSLNLLRLSKVLSVRTRSQHQPNVVPFDLPLCFLVPPFCVGDWTVCGSVHRQCKHCS